MLLGIAASLRVLRPPQPHALVTITLMQPAIPLPVVEGGEATPRIVSLPAPPPNPPPINLPQPNALLDESATRTVRDRWRFIPAHREGVTIESWVEVPIKFVLAES